MGRMELVEEVVECFLQQTQYQVPDAEELRVGRGVRERRGEG